MTTSQTNTWHGMVRRTAGWLVAGAAGWLWSAQSAQAGDVYWSVGVHQPGVSVGVSNAPPVVVQSAPRVIYAPAPRVIYSPAPVVVYPAPLYRTRWMPPGHRKHGHKDRFDRRDDSRHDRWGHPRDNRWGDHDHRR